jgi:hypothetical protein
VAFDPKDRRYLARLINGTISEVLLWRPKSDDLTYDDEANKAAIDATVINLISDHLARIKEESDALKEKFGDVLDSLAEKIKGAGIEFKIDDGYLWYRAVGGDEYRRVGTLDSLPVYAGVSYPRPGEMALDAYAARDLILRISNYADALNDAKQDKLDAHTLELLDELKEIYERWKLPLEDVIFLAAHPLWSTYETYSEDENVAEKVALRYGGNWEQLTDTVPYRSKRIPMESDNNG